MNFRIKYTIRQDSKKKDSLLHRKRYTQREKKNNQTFNINHGLDMKYLTISEGLTLIDKSLLSNEIRGYFRMSQILSELFLIIQEVISCTS